MSLNGTTTAALLGEPTSLLLEQLALGAESGAPLDEVAGAVAENCEPGPPRSRLEATRDRLRQAGPGADPVAALAGGLPARLRPLLEVGALRGDLPTALRALARQEASRQDLRRRVRGVFAYPLLVLGMLAALALFVSLVVIPPFNDIFDEFGLELPAMTGVALAFGKAAPLLFGAAAVIVVAVVLTARFPPTRPWAHWLRATAPLMGRVWVWSGHEQLATQMATLTGMGLPLDEALDHAAAGLADRSLAIAVRRLGERCREGVPLGEAMASSRAFERPLTATVAAAESGPPLAEAWADAADDYRQQLGHYTKFLARITVPVLLILVGAALAALVGSLFLPLVSLIENLSG